MLMYGKSVLNKHNHEFLYVDLQQNFRGGKQTIVVLSH